MQSQPATTLTDEPHPRPELRVLPTVRSRRLFRAFGAVTALFLATGGYVHLCLYRHGYRAIPKIGTAFLLQATTSVIVVAALIVGPHAAPRIAHVSDRAAGALTQSAAAMLAIGTLIAFALSRTPGGLFNFRERGLQPAPQALIAFVAEIAALAVLGTWLVAGHLARDQPKRG